MTRLRVVSKATIQLLMAIALVMFLAVDPVFSETYQYDETGRLAGVTYDDGSSITYDHDAGGNMIGRQPAIADLVAPSTIANPMGGLFSSPQSVALSCSDGVGSGCASTFFTTDGIDPTAASSVYFSAISIATNTTLKFFSVDNAGNSEAVRTESYIVNSPPETFNLVSPDANATGEGTTVTFVWEAATDSDGDNLSYQIIVCEDATFVTCTPTIVASLDKIFRYAGMTPAAGGFWGGMVTLWGALAFGVRLCRSRSRSRIQRMWPRIAAYVILLGIFSSCGGGGGSSSGSREISAAISGLNPATTYFWKVTADDGMHTTDSETRSFTTQ